MQALLQCTNDKHDMATPTKSECNARCMCCVKSMCIFDVMMCSTAGNAALFFAD
jgi:glucokinase